MNGVRPTLKGNSTQNATSENRIKRRLERVQQELWLNKRRQRPIRPYFNKATVKQKTVYNIITRADIARKTANEAMRAANPDTIDRADGSRIIRGSYLK